MWNVTSRWRNIVGALLLALAAGATLAAVGDFARPAQAAKCDKWACVSCSFVPEWVVCVFDGGNSCECCECRIIKR